MSNQKLVKSTRNIEEHIDNILTVQEAKAKGKTDRVICKELKISHTTLQKYKDIIVKQNLTRLTPDYQNEKRCELDEQLQTIIRKLFSVVETIDTNFDDTRRDIEDILNNPDIDVETRIRMRKYARYPVEDLVEIKKIMVNAVELRSKVWGLENSASTKTQINHNRKMVFQISSQETDASKLDKIAESVIANVHKVN
jgi:hypothetical protein